jgi:uncharacterized protein YfdQ (DUF2303 family)
MSDNADLIKAGQQLSEPRNIGEGTVPYMVLPKDSTVHTLEHLLPEPLSIKATPHFSRVDSFIEYIKRHKTPEASLLFAEVLPQGATMSCVLDYHRNDNQPGWCRHIAFFRTQTTPEWDKWLGNSGPQQLMGQERFAAFIEDGVKEIVEPDGAELLAIVSRLEGTTSVEFVSGVRLDNGNHELKYVETTSTKGSIQVPQVFELGLTLFDGSGAYSIPARLRYRIQNKALVFWYELIKPHLVVQDAVNSLLERVRQETDLEPLYGSP